MDEVYIVVNSWQLDVGETNEEVYVFDSLEKAHECLDALTENSLKYWEEGWPNSHIVERDDMYVVFYEDGAYFRNHETITIYQREINDTEW